MLRQLDLGLRIYHLLKNIWGYLKVINENKNLKIYVVVVMC